jgi:glycosyltransferase involved in cell wall biosynthesis
MPSNKLYFNYKSKIISMFLTILYKRAYKIIAQTEEMETEIIDSYKVKKGKVFTITNPVDKDLIASKLKNLNYPFPERNVINYVAVGNVHFAKGYDTLIKAFKKLTEDISNVHLYIIGRDDSEYSRYLKKMVIDIHLESKIHFLGFESNPYVYMKFCDAYVLSSRMEGLPNALLEAAYLNKPIVTTKCVPIVERIVKEAINGYIVDVDNIEQMHFALINVLKIHNIKNQIQDSSENLKSIFS